MSSVDATSSSPVAATPLVWTIREVVAWSSDFLKRRGIDTARLDTELLLAHALGCKRLQLYLDIDKPLQQSERDAFKRLLKRRSEGEPMAYITGERDFWGRTFQVDARVLIPRPDTEILIERVLADHADKSTSLSLLDIGTGSGCISLSLIADLPAASAVAVDVSTDALAVAKINAERLQISDRVTFIEADALNLAGAVRGEFDVIVSNPPYIADDDPELAKGVRDHEPHLALFAGARGLDFYQVFAEQLQKYLRPRGRIYLEIGHDQGAAVSELMRNGGWSDVKVYPDLQGHDRVIVGVKP